MITFVVNCKAMAGRKQNCQVHAGRSKKICKEILGQVTSQCKVQAYISIYMACTLHLR
jgi:hypothetical protein